MGLRMFPEKKIKDSTRKVYLSNYHFAAVATSVAATAAAGDVNLNYDQVDLKYKDTSVKRKQMKNKKIKTKIILNENSRGCL